MLAHIAYAVPPISREQRASHAKTGIQQHFNGKQQAFLDFVLSHHVSEGVGELSREKLPPLRKGGANRNLILRFPKYLCQEGA